MNNLDANRLGMSTSQAAKYLGVSLSTVRRWTDQGLLPVSRTPGKQRRFRQEDLDQFLIGLQVRQPPADDPRDD